MRTFGNDDIIVFLSYLRVWIPKHGYEAPSLIEAWQEFKGSHVADQNPQIQDTTKLLTQQLIQRSRERT
ncbi:MAG TPA: hypothetical protein VNH41_05175 [Steroidobacteraceae bacterium]|nr:hypothetical protein [Steroidobacteraceae bacterium]